MGDDGSIVSKRRRITSGGRKVRVPDLHIWICRSKRCPYPNTFPHLGIVIRMLGMNGWGSRARIGTLAGRRYTIPSRQHTIAFRTCQLMLRSLFPAYLCRAHLWSFTNEVINTSEIHLEVFFPALAMQFFLGNGIGLKV